MRITSEKIEGIAVVTVTQGNQPRRDLLDHTKELIAEGETKILFDLTGVSRIDIDDIREITMCYEQAESRTIQTCWIVLERSQPEQLLKTSGVWNVIEHCASIQEGLDKLMKSR